MAGEKGHNVPLPRLEALGGAYGVFSNKTTRALSRGWSLVVNKKWICGERSDDWRGRKGLRWQPAQDRRRRCRRCRRRRDGKCNERAVVRKKQISTHDAPRKRTYVALSNEDDGHINEFEFISSYPSFSQYIERCILSQSQKKRRKREKEKWMRK